MIVEFQCLIYDLDEIEKMEKLGIDKEKELDLAKVCLDISCVAAFRPDRVNFENELLSATTLTTHSGVEHMIITPYGSFKEIFNFYLATKGKPPLMIVKEKEVIEMINNTVDHA